MGQYVKLNHTTVKSINQGNVIYTQRLDRHGVDDSLVEVVLKINGRQGGFTEFEVVDQWDDTRTLKLADNRPLTLIYPCAT